MGQGYIPSSMREIQWYQEKIVNSLPGMLIRGGWPGLAWAGRGKGGTHHLVAAGKIYAVLEHIPTSSRSPIVSTLQQHMQPILTFHLALIITDL